MLGEEEGPAEGDDDGAVETEGEALGLTDKLGLEVGVTEGE